MTCRRVIAAWASTPSSEVPASPRSSRTGARTSVKLLSEPYRSAVTLNPSSTPSAWVGAGRHLESDAAKSGGQVGGGLRIARAGGERHPVAPVRRHDRHGDRRSGRRRGDGTPTMLAWVAARVTVTVRGPSDAAEVTLVTFTPALSDDPPRPRALSTVCGSSVRLSRRAASSKSSGARPGSGRSRAWRRRRCEPSAAVSPWPRRCAPCRRPAGPCCRPRGRRERSADVLAAVWVDTVLITELAASTRPSPWRRRPRRRVLR